MPVNDPAVEKNAPIQKEAAKTEVTVAAQNLGRALETIYDNALEYHDTSRQEILKEDISTVNDVLEALKDLKGYDAPTGVSKEKLQILGELNELNTVKLEQLKQVGAPLDTVLVDKLHSALEHLRNVELPPGAQLASTLHEAVMSREKAAAADQLMDAGQTLEQRAEALKEAEFNASTQNIFERAKKGIETAAEMTKAPASGVEVSYERYVEVQKELGKDIREMAKTMPADLLEQKTLTNEGTQEFFMLLADLTDLKPMDKQGLSKWVDHFLDYFSDVNAYLHSAEQEKAWSAWFEPEKVKFQKLVDELEGKAPAPENVSSESPSITTPGQRKYI